MCRCIVSYGYAGISAGSECMPTVAGYLTRANCGLHIGNFELDRSDGEIRYRWPATPWTPSPVTTRWTI